MINRSHLALLIWVIAAGVAVAAASTVTITSTGPVTRNDGEDIKINCKESLHEQ